MMNNGEVNGIPVDEYRALVEAKENLDGIVGELNQEHEKEVKELKEAFCYKSEFQISSFSLMHYTHDDFVYLHTKEDVVSPLMKRHEEFIEELHESYKKRIEEAKNKMLEYIETNKGLMCELSQGKDLFRYRYLIYSAIGGVFVAITHQVFNMLNS